MPARDQVGTPSGFEGFAHFTSPPDDRSPAAPAGAPSTDGARLRRVFTPGTAIVVREVWDGLLWAARPAVVVADDGHDLVHWSPAGSLGCFATSRFIPERAHLPRDERQLVSLASRHWQYRGVPARGTSLTFVRHGSWVGVAATWRPDGTFVHWYVNFQLPMTRRPNGYDTLDLVLDIVVAPDGSWTWKDQEPFAEALGRGIFDPAVRDAVLSEAERVKREIAARTGPFDPLWMDWSVPAWEAPQLPDDFAAGVGAPAGAQVSLSPEPS